MTFPLAAGENLVGSARDNAVVLGIRGVSRHHAAIHVGTDGVSVVDLDSKNGIAVNGARVGRGALAAGDRLTIGPVALWVEEISVDDAAIGLPLPADDPSRRERSASRPTTGLGEGGVAYHWLVVLGEAIERLSRGPDDPQGALIAVVRGLDLAGAALVERRRSGEATVAAVAGRLGALPPAAPDAAGGFRLADGDGEPRLVWSETRVDGTASELVLWGDFEARARCRPLAAALGALLGARAEGLVGLERDAPSPSEVLRFPAGYVVSESPAMRAVYRQLANLADSDVPVLIQGETGVGKEPLARALHDTSGRRRGPFVPVNCAAIPAELLEAEMFGIGRNVATGVAGRQGRLVEADRGTLFLDEIGEMPPLLQAKLLRALQEQEVQPVGAAPVQIDVRIVAATNLDLRARVADGAFRADLYFRIAGLAVDVPPLRQRRDDVAPLLAHFLGRAARDAGKALRGLTVKALERLADYPWPGNVRELAHEARRLAYACPHGGVVDSGMLPDHVLVAADREAPAEAESLELRAHTERLERRLIRLALARSGGNQSRAAELLGLSRNGLANRLKRLAIDREPFGRDA